MRDKMKRFFLSCTLMILLILIPGCGSRGDDGLQEMVLEGGGQDGSAAEGEAGEELPSEEADDSENGADEGEDAVPAGEDSLEEKAVQEEDTAFVYVCGAVNSPGVYELKKDARVYEAIELAGGVTEEAAQELINQAQTVTDGERIYVPNKEEAEAYGNGTDIMGLERTGETDGNTKGKININTAGKEELMTLTGIGESKAESILNYREEHGDFQSTEDLMQIEGIKEGVFNKIKDDITI